MQMQSSDKLESSMNHMRKTVCNLVLSFSCIGSLNFMKMLRKKYTDTSEILAIILDNENQSCSGTDFDSSCNETGEYCLLSIL